MKSLAERQVFRAKQKAEEKRIRDMSPTDQTRDNPKVGTEGEAEAFDAVSWLDDEAKNINANLSDLSDDELSQIEQSEGAGKKRHSVLASIKKEKDARTNKGAHWSPNVG